MPLIYQGTCSRCGYQTPGMTDQYGAVLVDRPVENVQYEVAGAVSTSDEKIQFNPVHLNLVILSHPVESSSLARTGYTWRDLHAQGRHVRVTNVVCRECGVIHRHYKLIYSSMAGFQITLATSLAAAVIAGIYGRHIVVGLITFTLAAYLLAGATEAYAWLRYRWKFSQRMAELKQQSKCPHCEGHRARSISHEKHALCPQCQTRNIQFRNVGIS